MRGLFAFGMVGFAVLSVAASPAAHATDDTYPGYEQRMREIRAIDEERAQVSLSPQEAFARAQSVLRHLGAPPEADSQPLMDPLVRRQTADGVKALLPLIDPNGAMKRFLGALHDGGDFDAFQDADSRQLRDFSIALAEGTQAEMPADDTSFHQRLLRAQSNPSDRPLEGLRIAIDPGHMGSKLWDNITGKQVHDAHGHWLSEGVMNLQTALLLEQAFESMGAQVLLTHRELAPVTHVDYDHMDYHAYGLLYLRDETLDGWFQSLLGAGPAGSADLFSAVDHSRSVRLALQDSDANRDEYFVRGVDLIARSEAINAFDADIALVIHYDTSDPADDPTGLSASGYDATKTYVVGGYESAEVSSREQRSYLARHLLDAAAWDASLKLGRSVVSSLHSELGLQYDHAGGGSSLQAEPGVFARNLGVSRRVTGRALTYIECLYYNAPKEFAAIYDAHHPMMIGGQNYPYSDRVAQVAHAIQDGVVSFVRSYGD